MESRVQKKPKERIKQAALDLFYYQGFHSTTVRQIAQRAGVNPAMISYYFKGKRGLLEQLMVQFYEEYFNVIEQHQADDMDQGQLTPYQRLLSTLSASFNYLFEHYQMTRFIYRELTIDSTLIREIMTVYLGKEKYYYITLLEELKQAGTLRSNDVEMITLQLLNTLYMPFLQPQMIRKVYYIEPHSDEFKQRYLEQLNFFVENCCR
ncbi:forespore capture DNA-binding protein RefZ [Caldalkalibacillus thermarum]|uniref:forespore capture DNA-binding protein RefZ n=1 Tax=Caldalkalibacillus thermarum TaxID=296745 RepID=UPI0013052A20|nr:forespore capture DNA-binding protein RefZ [Caldalkalibacillus thermarum]